MESTAPSPTTWLVRRLARLLSLFGLTVGLLALLAYLVMICDPGPHAGEVLEAERGEQLERLRGHLRSHVEMLASTIGPRDTRRNPERLRRAADYVQSQLRGMGYEVVAQSYEVDGRTWRNLEVTRRGAELPEQIILVGAHYDSVPDTPGANDNASGTAALLELARLWARQAARRTVRFVAFVNEEPPHFKRATMGSRVYARAARARGDQIEAMLSLETMGYFSQQAGSQKYPPGFRSFYPSTGNFLAVVGNIRSRALVRRVTSALREGTALPIECVATWGGIQGVDWSDHASFWDEGYPAVMLTDTAPFRYPYYHRKEDTPDRLDYVSFARATLATDNVIRRLADE